MDYTVDPGDVHAPAFWEPLHALAIWGRDRRNAATIGDILTLRDELGVLPHDVAEAWALVAATPIVQRPPARQPAAAGRLSPETRLGAFVEPALAAMLGSLAPRDRHIFGARTLLLLDDTPEPNRPRKRSRRSTGGPTLEALGHVYGITRERVRQIQARTERRLRRSLAGERSLQWLVADLQTALGVAFPLEALGEVPLLAAMASAAEDREMMWRAAVWLAGFSFTKDGWVLCDGMTPALLLGELREQALAEGLLPCADARAALAAGGVVPPAVEVLLREDPPALKRFGDAFLPWGASLLDKAETILKWLHEPATVEEILEHAEVSASPRSTAQRMIEDDRFVRTGKSTFGLHAWGMEEYSGISDEIAQRIERAGGEVELEEIVAELTGQFGVAASSVRQYAHAPRFVTERGRVRLRRADESVTITASDPLTYRGVYRPSAPRLRYVIAVTSDTLRGSGRIMPGAVAHALGAEPGRGSTFVSETGSTVRIYWGMESASGPNIGSVKSLAEAAGAQLGDSLALDFDVQCRAVGATRIPAAAAGPERVRLTIGAGSAAGALDALAAALQAEPAAVRDRLSRRGDAAMLAAIDTAARFRAS